MHHPLLILSDSSALIGDIEYVFKGRIECISSDTLGWVQRYLKHHVVDLIIADMDTKMDEASLGKILEGLKRYRKDGTAFLFLVSEKRKLEIERVYDSLQEVIVSADWLIKPFSRDSLISSVERLCG